MLWKIIYIDQHGSPCCHWSTDDIEIIFRRGSWKASGEFAQTDVHRQISIVFKTPPYQDQDITEEVEVSITLRRLSDQMESEPVNFTYLPPNPGQSGLHCAELICSPSWLLNWLNSLSVLMPDPYEVKRKRKIKSDLSLREKSCVAGKVWAFRVGGWTESLQQEAFHFC